MPVGPIQFAAHAVQEVSGRLGYLRVDGSHRYGRANPATTSAPSYACSVPFAAQAVAIGIQAKWVGRTY